MRRFVSSRHRELWNTRLNGLNGGRRACAPRQYRRRLRRPLGPPTPGAPEPPWKRNSRAGVFEGDIAIVELRASLALVPDEIPQPPLRDTRAPAFAIVGRLVTVAILAVAGAYAILWFSTPPRASSEPQPAFIAAADPASNDIAATAIDPKAENSKTDRLPPPGGLAPYSVADYARDLTDGAGVAPAGPARPVSLAAAQTSVVPSAPVQPSPVQPALVPVTPPPPASADPTADRDEIAALLARSRTYLAAGDVAAARLVLRRAVEQGDSQAALALGSTYDPLVLKRLGVISFAADPAQAREWYSRAAELGSTDAPQRIEQLAQIER